MDLENTQKQMKKGVLEFCILSVIRQNEVYPSEIINTLKNAGLQIIEGTLYPLLMRLKNAGVLAYRWEESPAGPPRKYFHLTPDGLAFYQQLEKTWTELTTAVNQLIKD